MTRARIASLVVLVAAGSSAASAQTTGFDPSKPAPSGTAVQSVVQCGDNPTAMEPYDVSVTVKRVVRGKEAWAALQAADPKNAPASQGHEYLLAQVAIQMTAKVSPGNKTFRLGAPMQWVAMSKEGAEYAATAAVPPAPALTGPLRSGAPVEGWVAFQVDQKDKTPMLFFDPASGGATLRGSVLFFDLH